MCLKKKLKTKLNMHLHYLYHLWPSRSPDPFALLTPLRLPRSFPCTLLCSSQPNRMVSCCGLIVVLWCLWVSCFELVAVGRLLWVGYCGCVSVGRCRLVCVGHCGTVAVRRWLRVGRCRLVALCRLGRYRSVKLLSVTMGWFLWVGRCGLVAVGRSRWEDC